MSKNNHVPARKAMDDTRGRFHILTNIPAATESMKGGIYRIDNEEQYHAQSIPKHSEASLATANGNANITAIVSAIQVMITLRPSMTT